jgi:hypothetical protein
VGGWDRWVWLGDGVVARHFDDVVVGDDKVVVMWLVDVDGRVTVNVAKVSCYGNTMVVLFDDEMKRKEGEKNLYIK